MGIVMAGTLCSGKDSPQEEPALKNWPVLETEAHPAGSQKSAADIFAEAERITGCSAEILRGIAGTESNFRVTAVGDNGWSLGMFQLHSRWHKSRVEKYGDFNPFDPSEAAVIAGYIMRENLQAFDGDLRKAIAAYRQGVTSIRRQGILGDYPDRVLCWREDKDKLLSYIAYGITDTEEL
jgi:soluble lytic murein transglycosylase-like protein